jgi:5-methylcytosine-specific restriction endonuclease McrA
MNEITLLSNYYKAVSNKQFRDWGLNDSNKHRDKCLEKKNELYIGIYNQYEWLDRIFDKVYNNNDYNSQEHYVRNKRFSIPKELRSKCWEQYNDSLNGKCYVCCNSLRYTEMHAGHVNPVYYGGKNTIDNLRPICLSCNLSMGTQNLYDFKNKFYN